MTIVAAFLVASLQHQVKASSADLPITTKSKQLGGESTPPAFINAFAVAVPKESGDRARRGSLDKGTLCSSSSECASGLCLGIDNKHCCGPKGKSKGCTNCDYDGDCSCFGSTSPDNCVACACGYEQIDSGPHQYECFATTTITTTTTTTYTFKYTDFDVRSTWQIAAYVVGTIFGFFFIVVLYKNCNACSGIVAGFNNVAQVAVAPVAIGAVAGVAAGTAVVASQARRVPPPAPVAVAAPAAAAAPLAEAPPPYRP